MINICLLTALVENGIIIANLRLLRVETYVRFELRIIQGKKKLFNKINNPTVKLF